MSLWEANLWKLGLRGLQGDTRAWVEFNRIAEQYGVVLPTPLSLDDDITADEEQAVEQHFCGWAANNPTRASELLRELELTVPAPVRAKVVALIKGRPTARRIDFSLAEYPPAAHRARGG